MPINPNFHYLTTDPLTPTVRIPQSSRPMGEFDNVDAKVTITSPLFGTGNILSEHGLGEPKNIFGDLVDNRSSKLNELNEKGGNILRVITSSVYNDDRSPKQSTQYFSKTSGPSNSFEGTWINLDKKTNENTKLIIEDGERISVHAWGKCQPTDCDWKTEYGIKMTDDSYQVIWDQGFVVRNMLLSIHGESIIPTVTETYQLYDDGTHGDRFANNHYWSTSLSNLAIVEGNYNLHYELTITHEGKTFQREADQTIYVEAKIDAEKTKATIEDLGFENGRQLTKYTFVPMDSLGNFVGPGRLDRFEIETIGDVIIEDGVKEDGKGTYWIEVSWTESQGVPNVVLKQNGQIRQTLILPEEKLKIGMPPLQFPHDDVDAPICRSTEIYVTSDLGDIFCFPYSINGATIDRGFLWTQTLSLTLPMNTINSGTLSIEAPRLVFESKINGDDNEFIVLIDGEKTDHEEDATDRMRILKISFPDQTKKIEIIGTHVIPEFGSVAIMIFAATISILILTTRSRLSLRI